MFRPESYGRAGFGFRGFFFAILGRGTGFERLQKPEGNTRYFIDGSEKRGFVGLRRLVKAGNLAHKLQRSGADLVRTDRRVEVVKRFDVPAHGRDSRQKS